MNEVIKPTTKECFQLRPPGPTPCFIEAGRFPCVTDGCSVADRIEDLKRDRIDVDKSWLQLLLHSRCRISSLSPENREFRERTGRQ